MAVRRSTTDDLAIKLFLSSAAFEAEKQLYLQSRNDTNQGLSQFLPRVRVSRAVDISAKHCLEIALPYIQLLRIKKSDLFTGQ